MSNVKEGRLLLNFNKSDGDFVVHYPNKRDGRFVMGHLCQRQIEWDTMSQEYIETNFIEDLERRGYDPTTIRFQIDKKQVKPKGQQ